MSGHIERVDGVERDRWRLPGGTTVLLERDRRLPLVTVSIAWRRGCALEPASQAGAGTHDPGQQGRGPRGMQAAQLEERMARLGARFGGSVSHSAMRFGGTVLARNLEPFFALLSRLVSRPALRHADIERSRREMLAELVALRDADRALGVRALQRALFGRHRYGRPVGGTERSLRGIDRSALLERHAALTRRGNLVVGLAGDVDRATVERLLQEHLLPRLPEGAPPAERFGDPKPPAGRSLLLVDKPRRTQAQLFVATLGARADDPDLPALLLANTAFGGTFTSRLMQAIRVERGWSYGAYSSVFRDRRRDQWRMWTAAATEDAVACLALQLELLERWVARGITAAEHRFAQGYLVRSHGFDLDTAPKRLEERLGDELYERPEGEWARFPERIAAVSRRACNEALRRRIDPSRAAIVVVGTAERLAAGLEKLPGIDAMRIVSHERLP